MSKRNVVIVFDCGATNVRVVAIDNKGSVLASESLPNNTRPDPYFPDYRIWDVDEIWGKMCLASRKVLTGVDNKSVAGVTVTTFGVDGTLFDQSGKMLYPVISWQCERTKSVMENIDRYIPLKELYRESGVLPFSFNTINKLIWFRENKPELIDKSHRFLFMPAIFSYLLTGSMSNDTTMAGTSMLTSITSRSFSGTILGKIGFPSGKFGTPVEPGTIIGSVNDNASSLTGIPAGVPVIATGHDTQFAIFGSGADKNQPVLSSGTWEILMVRSESFNTGKTQLMMGITTELDARPGLYNIGNQWVASGILEWARKNMYADIKNDVYDVMIAAAEKVPAGSNGTRVNPGIFDKMSGEQGWQISGLKMDTSRDEIYRAMLEALSERLAEGKNALEKAGNFKTECILCVGGGSKNKLWNKLRAGYTGVPLKVIDQKETTVLGASFFVQAAAGNYGSPEDARAAIDYKTELIEP